MTDKKTPRQHLEDYTYVLRSMEIQQVAIDLLDHLGTAGSMRAVAILKRDQQVQLRKLDAAAARLGAPYPKVPT